MPEDTLIQKREKEKARLLWLKQSKQARAILVAQDRKDRVNYKNISGYYYYFWYR